MWGSRWQRAGHMGRILTGTFKGIVENIVGNREKLVETLECQTKEPWLVARALNFYSFSSNFITPASFFSFL